MLIRGRIITRRLSLGGAMTAADNINEVRNTSFRCVTQVIHDKEADI